MSKPTIRDLIQTVKDHIPIRIDIEGHEAGGDPHKIDLHRVGVMSKLKNLAPTLVAIKLDPNKQDWSLQQNLLLYINGVLLREGILHDYRVDILKGLIILERSYGLDANISIIIQNPVLDILGS